ncbi:MAG: PHP domain-containing protein [Promethearchaeota archaeon]
MIDLHLHSSFSDGFDSPSQLIEKALQLNLKAIALTDHDVIDGLSEFLSYGESTDIIVIPGIEISLKHEPVRELIDIHIVGLNIDINSVKLKKILNKQLKGRLNQKKDICRRLREEFGYDITYKEVQAIAGSTSIGRPHIVEVVIRNNPDMVKDKTKNSLFQMISIGGSAFVEREFELDLESAIDLINSAGGIPILAHPGIYSVFNRSKFVQLCVEAGIKGIEIEYTYSKNRPFYNTNKAEWAQEILPNYYRKLADKFNLIKSGGSDYHGGKKGINIGDAKVPDSYLKDFI